MAANLEAILESRDNTIVLTLRGRYDLTRLRQVIREVGKRCRETDCRRVLADARGHVGGIDILDLHLIGEMISREIPRGCRVAVVVSKARLAMDRHLETVAVNRGVPFLLFTKTDEARYWLNGFRPGSNGQTPTNSFATDEHRQEFRVHR